jgi:hypothetical protein
VITDVELERIDLELRCSAVFITYFTSLLIAAVSCRVAWRQMVVNGELKMQTDLDKSYTD